VMAIAALAVVLWVLSLSVITPAAETAAAETAAAVAAESQILPTAVAAGQTRSSYDYERGNHGNNANGRETEQSECRFQWQTVQQARANSRSNNNSSTNREVRGSL